MFGKKKSKGDPFGPCDRGQHLFQPFGAPFQSAIDPTIKQRIFCPRCSSFQTVVLHDKDDRIQARK